VLLLRLPLILVLLLLLTDAMPQRVLRRLVLRRPLSLWPMLP